MNRQLLLVMLCLGLVLSTTFARIAAADDGIDDQNEIDDIDDIGEVDEVDDFDEVDDDDDDEIEWLEERELKIESDDDLVTVESEFENNTMENEYDMKFSTSGGILLDLGFSAEVNSTEFELEVKVLFQKLVEFIDQNGDGIFNSGEGVQTVDLTTMRYSSPTVTTTTSKDGQPGYRIESTTVDAPFIFQIIADVFPTKAVVDGATVKPSETKITIVVEDFPYQDGGSLALLIKAASEAEMEEEDHETESEVEVNSATAQGYFSWIKEAVVDGVSQKVNSSVVGVNEGKLIALVYPNGNHIIHDPKLGFNLLAIYLGLPWFYVAAGAALVTVAVFVAIKTYRPRLQGLSVSAVRLFKGAP